MRNLRWLSASRAAPLCLLVACATPIVVEPTKPPSLTPNASTSIAIEPTTLHSAETPEEIFRQRPPPPGQEGVFQAPVPFDYKLPSGMRVLHLENHGMPVVSFQIVVRRGAAVGPQGVASLLGPMLFQGTPSRSALELSDALEGLGARHRIIVNEDSILVNITVLSKDAERALMLLADAIQNANFPRKELEQLKAQKIQLLKAEKDLPQVQLQRAITELLYPEKHPYRAARWVSEQEIRSIHPATLARYFREQVQPDNTVLMIAGDLSRDRGKDLIMQAFGKWRGKALRTGAPPAPSNSFKAPSVLLLDLADAPQTSIALCAVGAPYTSPDHDNLMVLNLLLTRRINANLRGRHAYTYGASSQFSFRHGAGPFTAGGEVVREKTAEAIREILLEVAELRDQLVGYEELQEAKGILSAISARFETSESTIAAMTSIAVFGLDDNDFMTLRVRLQMVSRETLQKAARAYLASERLHLALVGDAARIEENVRALQLGRMEVRKITRATIPPSSTIELPND